MSDDEKRELDAALRNPHGQMVANWRLPNAADKFDGGEFLDYIEDTGGEFAEMMDRSLSKLRDSQD